MLLVESGNSLPVDDVLTCVAIQKLYANFQLLDFEILMSNCRLGLIGVDRIDLVNWLGLVSKTIKLWVP